MAYGTTNAQKKQSASALTFSQLVRNECITNKTYGSLGVYSVLDNAYVGVANHKYFVKAKVSGFSGNWNMRYKLSGENDEVFIANNSENSQVALFTAQYNFSELDIYPTASGITIDGLMVIDLTSTFGSGLEPSLSECEAIFNQDYYAYGSNTIDVLVDGASVYASYQKPIIAKLVEFAQVCKDAYNHNWQFTYQGSQNTIVTPTGLGTTYGDCKYYIYIEASANNAVLYYNDGSNHALSYSANGGYLTGGGGANLDYFMIGCPNDCLYSSVKIINLTKMGLDDLTLEQCKALFNAPYYAYTSSAQMQLLYDGTKPIALADLPQGYNKLDKDTSVTTYIQAYCKNTDGNPTMMNISRGSTANALPRRDANGQIAVPLTPTDNAHAVSKQYADGLNPTKQNGTEYITSSTTQKKVVTITVPKGYSIITARAVYSNNPPTRITLTTDQNDGEGGLIACAGDGVNYNKQEGVTAMVYNSTSYTYYVWVTYASVGSNYVTWSTITFPQ